MNDVISGRAPGFETGEFRYRWEGVVVVKLHESVKRILAQLTHRHTHRAEHHVPCSFIQSQTFRQALDSVNATSLSKTTLGELLAGCHASAVEMYKVVNRCVCVSRKIAS